MADWQVIYTDDPYDLSEMAHCTNTESLIENLSIVNEVIVISENELFVVSRHKMRWYRKVRA